MTLSAVTLITMVINSVQVISIVKGRIATPTTQLNAHRSMVVGGFVEFLMFNLFHKKKG